MARAIVTGGASAFSYNYDWSSSSDDKDTISGLLPNTTYTLTVKDTNGCAVIQQIKLSTPPRLSIIKIDSIRPHCSYSSDGVAIFTASGGVPYSLRHYQFEMKSSRDTVSITDTARFKAAQGHYYISVTDTNNCLTMDSIHIINRDTLRVAVDSMSMPSCYGSDDGWIRLKAKNGELINGNSYIYTCITDSTSQLVPSDTARFGSLISRAYRFTVMDAFGCIDEADTTLSQPNVMAINFVDSIPNRCYNDSTASLKVKASGGTSSGYQFSYSFHNRNAGFTDAEPGNYLTLQNLNWNYNDLDLNQFVIRLHDSNYKPSQPKCIVTATFTLPEVRKISDSIGIRQPSCYMEKDGRLSVLKIQGGKGSVASWKFAWVKDDLSDTLTQQVNDNLGEGAYNLRITDSVGCSITQSDIRLTNPPATFITHYGATPASCTACSNGTIMYTVNNLGTARGYSLLVDYQSYDPSGDMITGLLPGTHYLEVVTIPNGCTAYDTFTISYLPPVLELISYLPAATGVSNGSITVKATGGTGTYTFKILDGQGNVLPVVLDVADLANDEYLIEQLAKGDYTIVAVDGNNVSSNSITLAIEESNRLSIQVATLQEATCNASSNGSAKVFVSGTPGYTYAWANIRDTLTILSTSVSLVNVPTGIYRIAVMDADGSKATALDTIGVLDSLKIGLSPVIPLCHNTSTGQIITFVQGGSGKYGYAWSTGDTTASLTKLTAGQYSLNVTDRLAAVCFASQSVDVPEPDPLSLTYSFTSPTCYEGSDGAMAVSVHGGTNTFSSYSWYRVTGSILTPLIENAAVQTLLKAGVYKVSVTDDNGCSMDTTLALMDALPISLAAVDLQSPSCFGKSDGKLSLTLVNGHPRYMVNWLNVTDAGVDTFVTNLQGAKYYKIAVTDAKGCTMNDSVYLPETPLLSIDSFTYTEPTCSYSYNGTIKAFVSGGTLPYSYYWPNQLKSAVDSITNIKGGNYLLAVKDKNLCSAVSRTAVLVSPAALSLNVTLREPSCYGLSNGAISLSASGGSGAYSYQCNSNPVGPVINNQPANVYDFVLSDDNGCSAQYVITLLQPDPLAVSYLVVNKPKCNAECNGIVNIVASGGTLPYSVLWPDSSVVFNRTGLCGGNYSITVSDFNQCTAKNTVKLAQPDSISIDNVVTVLPSCYGGCNGQLIVSPKGGTIPYTLAWNNGQSGDTATNLCAGNYPVAITDSNLCKFNVTLNLPETEKVSITGIPSYMKLCLGQVKSLNPGSWASYQWSRNDTVLSSEPLYNLTQSGTYTLNVVSSLGCTDTETFVAEYVTDLLNADFLLSGDAIAGEEVSIIDITWPLPDTIWWKYNTDSISLIENNSDRQTIVFNYPGVYDVQLFAQSAQCFDSITQSITVYASDSDLNNGNRPVETEEDIKKLLLYPNPSSGAFTVDITLKEAQNITVEVIKITDGTLVIKKPLEGSDTYQVAFDMSGQLAGVYSFNVTTNNQKGHFLFVIVK
jgi:hypothetical protein